MGRPRGAENKPENEDNFHFINGFGLVGGSDLHNTCPRGPDDAGLIEAKICGWIAAGQTEENVGARQVRDGVGNADVPIRRTAGADTRRSRRAGSEEMPYSGSSASSAVGGNPKVIHHFV